MVLDDEGVCKYVYVCIHVLCIYVYTFHVYNIMYVVCRVCSIYLSCIQYYVCSMYDRVCTCSY